MDKHSNENTFLLDRVGLKVKALELKRDISWLKGQFTSKAPEKV